MGGAYPCKGWIPKKYEELHPGFAKLIFDLTQKQADHRLHQENKITNYSIFSGILGMLFGFTIAVFGMYTAYKIIEIGHPTAVAIFGAVPLAVLSGAFIKASKVRENEHK